MSITASLSTKVLVVLMDYTYVMGTCELEGDYSRDMLRGKAVEYQEQALN